MSKLKAVKNLVRLFSPQGRCAMALGAGMLQAAAFPQIGWSWLGWAAPGLIVMLSLGQPKAFRLGYCAGLGHYLLSLYWLLLIPLPVKAVGAWLAVSGILALYTAGWTWFCARTCPRELREALGKAEKEKFKGAGAVEWARGTFWALSCAAAWVAMEMGIARIMTGFPWNLLGASQHKALPLIQISSITGIYGVSFLVAWVSVSLVLAVIAARGRSIFSIAWLGEILLPLAVLSAVVGFGMHQLASRDAPQKSGGRELTVALVQPSIPQRVIWKAEEKTNRFNKLVALSEAALAANPDLLVWPEAALPNFLTRFNLLTHDAITNLVVPHRIWMILGANDAEPKKHSADPDALNFFNSSFLVAPNGELVAKYHKRQLVMLGEYMPLGRWFPFLRHLRSLEGFSPGDGPVPFELSAPRAKISVLICFEDVFPHLVREYVSDDTDFLLNLTNNGWFGESAAQWQHALSGMFRAVENGVPLVRCTNNGLTCWIDAQGRVHEVYFPGSRDIYQAGFKIARIPLLEPGERRKRTIYNRYGDWFGWGCVIFTVSSLGGSLFRRAKV